MSSRKQLARTPLEIASAIEQKSNAVRDAAAGLTQRIERFQTWLGKLPGRTDTCYTERHPDAPPDEDFYVFGLRLHREDKEWVISYGAWMIDDDPHPIDWKPLVSASLKTKLNAVKMLPDLLVAIEQSQQSLVSEIEKASRDFDGFAEELGIVDKEGK